MEISTLVKRISPLLKRTYPYLPALFAFLAYGSLIPFLGIYGDDWSYIWLMYKGAGLSHFLQNNRESLVVLYNILQPILQPEPWQWHALMFVMRIANIYAFYFLLKLTFKNQKPFVFTATLLYSVYPGFQYQAAAVTFVAGFVFLNILYLSWILQLMAQQSKWGSILRIFSFILSFINLVGVEYFFFAELFRPVWIWFSQSDPSVDRRSRLRKVIKESISFVGLFVGVVIWRIFNQSTINRNYDLLLLDHFQQDAGRAFIDLVLKILHDFWVTAPGAWMNAIYPYREFADLNTPRLLFFLLFGATALLAFVILAVGKFDPKGRSRQMLGYSLVGCAFMLIAGTPIWLADLNVLWDYTTSRLTTPFMLGAVLFLAGLICAIPRSAGVRVLVLALLLGASVGKLFLVTNSFRMDWRRQQSYYFQLITRIPMLEPGTMLLLSANPTATGEENSLSAAVNWLYAESAGREIPYYVYFNPEKYESDLGTLESGKVVPHNHMAGHFTANTDNIISLFVDPRGCLRIMNPLDDPLNKELSKFNRQAAKLSGMPSIKGTNPQQTLDSYLTLFGTSPEARWCVAFQEADLARQQGNWQRILEIAEAIDFEEYHTDWMKVMVFAEAYARMNDWESARTILDHIRDVSRDERPMYCARLDQFTAYGESSSLKDNTIQSIRQKLGCN